MSAVASALSLSLNHLLAMSTCTLTKKGLAQLQRNFPPATNQKLSLKPETALKAVPTRIRVTQKRKTVLVLYQEYIQTLAKVIGTALNGPDMSVKFTQNTVDNLNALLTGTAIGCNVQKTMFACIVAIIKAPMITHR